MTEEMISRHPNRSELTPVLANWVDITKRAVPTYFRHIAINNGPNEYRANLATTLGINIWLEYMGYNPKTFYCSGIYKSVAVLRTLIKQYDNVIDNSKQRSLIRRSDFKIPKNGQIVHDFVYSVKNVEIGEERKRDIFKSIGKFRREQFLLIHSIGDNQLDTLSFDEAVSCRDATNTSIAGFLSKIVSSPFSPSSMDTKNSERFFGVLCKSGQAIDDAEDCLHDLRARNLNLVISASNHFPSERALLDELASNEISKVQYRQLNTICPNTTSVINSYLFKVVNTLPTNRTLTSAIACALYRKW